MCVLPVLLSWFGPQSYLNATRIGLTSNMSIKLRSQTINSATSEKSTAASTSHKVGDSTPPNTNTNATEEHPSTRSPPSDRPITHNHESQPKAALYGLPPSETLKWTSQDEIGTLLDNLERNTVHTQLNLSSRTSELNQPAEVMQTHEDIVRHCEEYLGKNNDKLKPEERETTSLM